MAKGTDPAEAKAKRFKLAMEHLGKQSQFKQFLFAVIQEAGIFRRATDGSTARDLSYFEGRRDLGLVILDMVELGQPFAHPDGMPLLTLIQTLREEANPPPSERDDDEGRNEQRRYDRNAELDDGDEDGDPPYRR